MITNRALPFSVSLATLLVTGCTLPIPTGIGFGDGGFPTQDGGNAAPSLDASGDAVATPADAADGAPLVDSDAATLPDPTDSGSTPSPPPTPVTVPYALPNAGQASLIGTNTADDIAPYSVSNWRYSLFASYGGGCYVRDFSSAGAYALAAGGGHNHPPNFGAAMFDFADATWRRIDNTNGMPWREQDLEPAETNGSPNYEIALSGVTPGSVPSPGHPYMNVLPIPASMGGGPKGSLVTVIRSAVLTVASGSHRSHRFDLATGKWSRLSTNLLGNVADPYRFSVEAPSVFDEGAKRYYQLPLQIHDVDHIALLDGNTWTWQAMPSWAYPPSTNGTYSAAFLDDKRRLILVQDDAGTFRAIDLANVAAGPKTLTVSGTPHSGAPNRWEYNPADDSFYTYKGSGQVLHRLKPPASAPLSSTWTVSQVTIGGATLATDVGAAQGTRHYTRFFYVKSLGVFAWIAGGANKVALIRP